MIALQTNIQPVALTVDNYLTEVSDTLRSKIEELMEDSFHLDDMLDFINEHGDDNFINYYDDYVRFGEDNSYAAVDAFIEEFGLQSFTQSNFKDSYLGQYDSKADYAEQYTSDVYCVELPSFVEVDWEATFDNLDVVFSANGYVFNTQF